MGLLLVILVTDNIASHIVDFINMLIVWSFDVLIVPLLSGHFWCLDLVHQIMLSCSCAYTIPARLHVIRLSPLFLNHEMNYQFNGLMLVFELVIKKQLPQGYSLVSSVLNSAMAKNNLWA